jgi:NDP-sugar pyrophosphorylase family protein
LKEFTKNTPKPILAIPGGNILQRLILQVSPFVDMSDIWINVSTLPNQMIKSISQIEKATKLNILWEPELLGSSLTFYEMRKLFNDDFLIIHGDLVLSNSYVLRLWELLNNTSESLLICHGRQLSNARSIVEISKHGLVYRLLEAPTMNSRNGEVLCNSGIYFVQAEEKFEYDYIPKGDLVKNQIQTLISQKKLFAKVIEEPRIAVDSPEALSAAISLARFDRPL